MEKQTLIYSYLAKLLGVNVKPRLPTDEGYALQVTPSAFDTMYLDHETDDNMEFLLLGKAKNQQTLADKLYSICNKLKTIKSYSNGVYLITTNTPSLVDIEGDCYIWQCQITVKFEN